jgi:hypothetical protein
MRFEGMSRDKGNLLRWFLTFCQLIILLQSPSEVLQIARMSKKFHIFVNFIQGQIFLFKFPLFVIYSLVIFKAFYFTY